MAETERQVEAHLDGHLQTLPPQDERSRQIVRKMKEDEAHHRASAEAAGGVPLPAPARRHARHVQDHDDDGVLDLSGIRIAAMRGGNPNGACCGAQKCRTMVPGHRFAKFDRGLPEMHQGMPERVNPLSKTRRLGKSLIHAGLRSARPNLAANSQRPTLTIPGLKIILASHKRSVLCISSDVETQTARCKPRMPSRAKAAPNMPRLSPPPSSFGGFSPRSHDLGLFISARFVPNFMDEVRPDSKTSGRGPGSIFAFSLGDFACAGRKALQSPDDDCAAAMPRFRRIRPPWRSDRTRMGGLAPGVTLCPGDLHFLIAAIYERYTCPG